MAESEKDRIARQTADLRVSFDMALSDKRKYPVAEVKAFVHSARRYIEVTAGDSMIRRSVVQAANGLREFLQVERKRIPGDILFEADRLECQFFAGYDPGFDGDEPPDLDSEFEDLQTAVFIGPAVPRHDSHSRVRQYALRRNPHSDATLDRRFTRWHTSKLLISTVCRRFDDRQPPSQTWRTFLENHLESLVSIDFFTVPTIRFQVLYVFLVLAHERRRIVHFAVTAHPTAEWTAHQLREAFPWDSAPRFLLRDRDRIFGHEFVKQVKAMGIQQVLSTPRSPWQPAYVERVIGSIRRECLDHLIVFNERSLKRYLQAYCTYYHRTRTHLALAKDCPEPREVQPPEAGRVVSIPEIGGLHHRYERLVA